MKFNWEKHNWMLKLLSELMTHKEREEHRRSWVYRNLKLSNPDVTRETVNRQAEKEQPECTEK